MGERWKSAARPICVFCDKQYGQKWTDRTQLVVKAGEPIPAYQGNGFVTKDSIWQSISTKGTQGGVPYGPGDKVVTRWIWDGESWWRGYEPFCTLRCALAYARAAHAAITERRSRKVAT
jgi:hypothetical protein